VLPAGHINAGGHRAAIVTAAYTNTKGQVTETAAVDLTAFLLPHEDAGPTIEGTPGFAILEHVPADFETKKPGTWHWPESGLDDKDQGQAQDPAAAGVPPGNGNPAKAGKGR
jgi:hypothetical protein